MQVQIQALLAAAEGTTERSNTVSNIEIAKLLVFSGEAKKWKSLLWYANYVRGPKTPKPDFKNSDFATLTPIFKV